MTRYDYLNAQAGRFKVTDKLPTSPVDYYGQDRIGVDTWMGGEVIYHSGDSRLYIQTAVSTDADPYTAVWKRLVTVFATSTSSTTTSTSTSTSTTTSSTSTSSTTTMP